jgi:hypothetical protein
VRQAGAACVAVQRIGRQTRNEAHIRGVEIVVRDAGKIVVQRVIAEPDRRPEFGPDRTWSIYRVNQLRVAPDWRAVARITVRTQSSDGVDHGDPRECNVPGQQATPRHVIDYQHCANREPG